MLASTYGLRTAPSSNQVYGATQHMLQRSFGTKEILKVRRGAFGKLDQEIHIAGGRFEVIGPRRRAEHFHAAHVKALANGGDAGTVLGDGGVRADTVLQDSNDVLARRILARLEDRVEYGVLVY